jgi:hypothetical protein
MKDLGKALLCTLLAIGIAVSIVVGLALAWGPL